MLLLEFKLEKVGIKNHSEDNKRWSPVLHWKNNQRINHWQVMASKNTAYEEQMIVVQQKKARIDKNFNACFSKAFFTFFGVFRIVGFLDWRIFGEFCSAFRLNRWRQNPWKVKVGPDFPSELKFRKWTESKNYQCCKDWEIQTMERCARITIRNSQKDLNEPYKKREHDRS